MGLPRNVSSCPHFLTLPGPFWRRGVGGLTWLFLGFFLGGMGGGVGEGGGEGPFSINFRLQRSCFSVLACLFFVFFFFDFIFTA